MEKRYVLMRRETLLWLSNNDYRAHAQPLIYSSLEEAKKWGDHYIAESRLLDRDVCGMWKRQLKGMRG